MEQEHVVLVDEDNSPLGLVPKASVHKEETEMHRAFSSFIFKDGKLLLQQRALSKKTWPGIWSNSCCGHPSEGETWQAAIQRRLREELGMSADELHVVLPRYMYAHSLFGVQEHEVCPVFVGKTSVDPQPNPEEVESIRWVTWQEFMQDVNDPNTQLSAWCVDEAKLLDKNDIFRALLERYIS